MITRESVSRIVLFGVLSLVASLALVPSANAAKKPPSSFVTTAGTCLPGPLDTSQVGNPFFPDAPFNSCNRTKKKVSGGTYLVMVTANWFTVTIDNAAYPSTGQCRLLIDGRVVPGTQTDFGSIGVNDNEWRQSTLAVQGIKRLSAKKHTFDFRCSQNQGRLKLSRSTIVAVRVS